MAEVTMDSKEILECLVSLLKRLGEATSWVSRQEGEITFEVPDELSRDRTKPPLLGGCFAPTRPGDRVYGEILLGILRRMEEKGSLRPKSKRRK